MTPFITSLWFDTNAQEAVEFYTSLFPNSSIEQIDRYTKDNPHGPEGSVMTISFTLNGNKFLAINGGPVFSFTPAVSIIVPCDDQTEIDTYWNALGKGGTEMDCGWITDRFGLSWQIVPKVMMEILKTGTEVQKSALMRVMLTMKKLEIAPMQNAIELK